jgi:hypothetical protein
MMNEKSQEKLRICTCKVDPKGQVLHMVENDGSNQTHRIPMSTIAEVQDVTHTPEEMERLFGEDQACPVRLTFKNAQQQPLEMIFAAVQDFMVWRDGLKSIVVGGPASPPRAAKSAAKAKAASPRAAQANPPSRSGVAGQDNAHLLEEQLMLQEELIAALRQENGVLNEVVKQKDVVIQQLTLDLQSRGTKGDHCSKTESTSRESDDHLRDREMAILKRQNLKLQKEVKKKKQTIENLMQTLQNALAGQTSDGDMLKTDDDADDDDDSDVAMAPAAAPRNRPVSGVPMSVGSESEPEDIREEMRALTELMQIAGSNGITLSSPPVAQQPRSPAGQKRAAIAATQAGNAPQGMAGFDFSAVGGAAPAIGGMSKKSKSALEALTGEMRILEEKKRKVEQLAATLEPSSDAEEDDGFPLQ